MIRPLIASVLLALLSASCAFHSTATRMNDRVGPNGEPVFIKSTSSVGMNLFIIIPLLGATNMERILDSVTADIAIEGGDRVRVIQSGTETYWYGFPPFTWILTPVVTTVAVDYEPTAEALAAARVKNGYVEE